MALSPLMHIDIYSPTHYHLSRKTCPETNASGSLSQSCTSVSHCKATLHLFWCFIAFKCLLPILICEANGLHRLMSSVMNEIILQNCWVIKYARRCVCVGGFIKETYFLLKCVMCIYEQYMIRFTAVYWLILALSFSGCPLVFNDR